MTGKRGNQSFHNVIRLGRLKNNFRTLYLINKSQKLGLPFH